MLSKGEIVFIITRRLFEGDLRRHFVGEIQEVSAATLRVRGYVFVFDDSTKQFVRRDEQRIRIFSTIDAGIVIAVLPAGVQVEDIGYRIDKNNRRILTDGKTFELNVNEFGADR